MSPSPRENPEPLLLSYTPIFGTREPEPSGVSGVRWTSDKTRLAEADVVLFHLPDIRPSSLVGLRKYPGQLWVVWTFESTVHYPRGRNPVFLAPFDLVALCDSRSDLRLSYVPSTHELEGAIMKPLPAKTSDAPVAMLQSSPIDRSGRNAYAAELMEQIRIDSYGRFLNNRRIPAGEKGELTKEQIIAPYRFCIAFENARDFDYVTEKLYGPLLAGTVPIYRGAPNVAALSPGADSFIDADDFASPGELAAYLRHLAQTPEEYARYFEWRRRPLPVGLAELARQSCTPWVARLVERLAEIYSPLGRTDGKPTRPVRFLDHLALRYLEKRTKAHRAERERRIDDADNSTTEGRLLGDT